jgi:NYN domain
MELSEHIDQMVLFSGDGDFRSLVAAMQRRGVRVTVVSTIATQPPMIPDDLRRQADVFIDLKELQPKIGRDPAPGNRDNNRSTGRVQLVRAAFRGAYWNDTGTLSDAWIAGGALVGRLKFAQTERGQLAEGMVARGELNAVSVGYRVTKWGVADANGNAVDPERTTLRGMTMISPSPRRVGSCSRSR